MNDLKDEKVLALQTCSKVVECPKDTSLYNAQCSSAQRQFLANVMKEADLLIVDVSLEHFQDADSNDFVDGRLAGLIRQHSSANIIFTLQVPSHADDSTVKKHSEKLEGNLERIMSKKF